MENERQRENEQTPEEILKIIAEAIEAGKSVSITQQREDGSFITSTAEPISVDGVFLTVEADGYGFDIVISKIKKVEIIEQKGER